MAAVGRFPQREVDKALGKVRRACLALPETSERPSHGGPAFFIRDKKCFVMFLNDHHDDGRLAIWCAAPDGVQVEMVDTDPERFFRPPYVGHRGLARRSTARNRRCRAECDLSGGVRYRRA